LYFRLTCLRRIEANIYCIASSSRERKKKKKKKKKKRKQRLRSNARDRETLVRSLPADGFDRSVLTSRRAIRRPLHFLRGLLIRFVTHFVFGLDFLHARCMFQKFCKQKDPPYFSAGICIITQKLTIKFRFVITSARLRSVCLLFLPCTRKKQETHKNAGLNQQPFLICDDIMTLIRDSVLERYIQFCATLLSQREELKIFN